MDEAGEPPRQLRNPRCPSWFASSAGVLLLLLSTLLTCPQVGSAQSQPIQFNHQIHVKQMTCVFCHRFYETREIAGRPELSRCMLCHAYPVSSSPEANKLRTFASERRQLTWVRLTRVAPFVRFSHQRHVAIGKVDCVACHGDIARATRPPTSPLVTISMQLCLDCHRAKALQLDAKALQALQAENLSKDTAEALQTLEHKRFRSSGDLLKAVAESAGRTPSDADQRLITGQLHQADPVTTDCFACHR
jgi:hypothetical protein